jgi:hypothetical protein
MDKISYENSINEIYNYSFNKIIELNNRVFLEVVNCKIGDIVKNDLTQKIFEITEIEFDYISSEKLHSVTFSNLPIIRVFGKPFYKNNNSQTGNATFLNIWDIHVLSDDEKLEIQKNIINKQRIHRNNKRVVNPLYKLECTLRSRTLSAFKSKGIKKNSRTTQLLGADFLTVKKHIESKFTEGMAWDNHGEWHIDHIKPLGKSKTESELIQRCHYTNLQPLWAIDNYRKSGKDTSNE